MLVMLVILGWCLASVLAAALIVVWLKFIRNAKQKCWCGKREMTAIQWEHINYWDTSFITGDGQGKMALTASVDVHYHPNLRKQCEVI